MLLLDYRMIYLFVTVFSTYDIQAIKGYKYVLLGFLYKELQTGLDLGNTDIDFSFEQWSLLFLQFAWAFQSNINKFVLQPSNY